MRACIAGRGAIVSPKASGLGTAARKHGMRAQKCALLPDEDDAEFAGALIEELAPVGALQAVLARRIAIAAWRLRADWIEPSCSRSVLMSDERCSALP